MRGIESPLAGFGRGGPFGSQSLNRPVITVPGAQALDYGDAPLVFASSISVSDAEESSLTITIAASSGTIDLDGTTGLSFSIGDGTGDATTTFSGTITNINNALSGLEYNPAIGGVHTITITAVNTEATTQATISIDVENLPQATVPGAQTLDIDDMPLVFETANSNLISVDDDVETSLTVSLSVTAGLLTLSQITGLLFTLGDGSSNAAMEFSGTIVNINAALDGMEFDHDTDEVVTLTVTVSNSSDTFSDDVSITVEDVVTPTDILSNFVITAIDGETASADIDCTETTGDIAFVIVPAAATAPDGGEIFSGTDGDGNPAQWAGSGPVASIDTILTGIAGLIQDTDWKGYAAHRATGPVYSNIPSSTFSTTDTTPVLTSPTDEANGSNAAVLGVTTDDPNGTLYWVVSTSATAPTATQIRAGQMHTGASAAAAGSQSISSAGAKTGIAATGLTGATPYYAHFHHRDAANNDSAVVSANGFTTDAAETEIGSGWAKDGETTGINLGSSPTGMTATANVADADGGNDAVELTTYSSTDGAASVQFSAITFHDGINHLQARIKDTGSGAPWVYFAIGNLDAGAEANTRCWFQPSTNTEGTNGSLATNVTVIPDGNGFYTFNVYLDLSAITDLTGNLKIGVSNANGTTTADRTTAEKIAIHDVKVLY